MDFEWLSWFKHEETSVESCDLQGSSSIGHTDENVEKVGKIINKYRRRPMPEITGRLGLSYGICQWILGEGLKVWKICARFVPRLLTHKAQQHEFFGARAWLLSPTSLLARCPFSVSSCFQEWNPSYKDVVSRSFLEFRSNRWLSYRKFQLCNFLRLFTSPLMSTYFPQYPVPKTLSSLLFSFNVTDQVSHTHIENSQHYIAL
jgi:hypothetical protein